MLAALSLDSCCCSAAAPPLLLLLLLLLLLHFWSGGSAPRPLPAAAAAVAAANSAMTAAWAPSALRGLPFSPTRASGGGDARAAAMLNLGRAAAGAAAVAGMV